MSFGDMTMTRRSDSGVRRLFRVQWAGVCALAVAWCLAIAPATRAAEAASPVEIVRKLYAAHALAFAGKGPLVHTGGPAALAYFAPAVAAKIRAKELDFDPIYDGQDAEISGLSIAAPSESPAQGDSATVLVRFTNFGKPVRLTYHLRRMPGGAWRIVDIVAANWQLSKLLAAKP